MQPTGLQVMRASKEYLDAVERAGYDVSHLRPKPVKPEYNVECNGQHRFFVAETGTVESEGKVCIVIVCTSCGESRLLEHTVAKPPQSILLQK